jgi:hypothetical protein
MMYEISPQMRILAIKLENDRRQKMTAGSGEQNKKSTETQTSTHQQDGMFDHQFGSGWREEGDYREGFKKLWKK